MLLTGRRSRSSPLPKTLSHPSLREVRPLLAKRGDFNAERHPKRVRKGQAFPRKAQSHIRRGEDGQRCDELHASDWSKAPAPYWPRTPRSEPRKLWNTRAGGASSFHEWLSRDWRD